MSTTVLEAAKNLPLPERLELLDALWESIVAEGYDVPLTTAQAEEIEHRLRAHELDPNDVIDWEAIQSELNSRFRKA